MKEVLLKAPTASIEEKSIAIFPALCLCLQAITQFQTYHIEMAVINSLIPLSVSEST